MACRVGLGVFALALAGLALVGAKPSIDYCALWPWDGGNHPLQGLCGQTYTPDYWGWYYQNISTWIIESPGYNWPCAYPPNTDCYYVISWDRLAGAGWTINITFLDFELEDDCSSDYVEIREAFFSPISID